MVRTNIANSAKIIKNAKITKIVNIENVSNISNTKSKSYIWIIFCLILLAIILFAIFYPRIQYKLSVSNGNTMQEYPMMQMESLENYEDSLMENTTNDDDPKIIMNSEKPTMIFFYAPWCGHCKTAKPEFQKLMQKAKGQAFMIDCDKHKEIAQKYNVQGFPTIRYYPNGPKNGNPREYMGDRSANNMFQFMSQ